MSIGLVFFMCIIPGIDILQSLISLRPDPASAWLTLSERRSRQYFMLPGPTLAFKTVIRKMPLGLEVSTGAGSVSLHLRPYFHIFVDRQFTEVLIKYLFMMY